MKFTMLFFIIALLLSAGQIAFAEKSSEPADTKVCRISLEGHEKECSCSMNSEDAKCYRTSMGEAAIYCKTESTVTSCSWSTNGCNCNTTELSHNLAKDFAKDLDNIEMEMVVFE